MAQIPVQVCYLNPPPAVCSERLGHKMDTAAIAPLHSRKKARDRHPFAGRRVLLVQQRPVESQAVCGMLEALGCRVTTVSESGNAILKLGQEPFALILSELDLPQLNGFQLAQYTRRRSPQTRILLMTACCQAEVVDYLNSNIVDGWLFKPFRLGELRHMMHNIFYA